MSTVRFPENPIITPSDVKPSQPEFEVVCAFNPGVAKLGEETILLLRVAERPLNSDRSAYQIPIYDPESGKIRVQRISSNSLGWDFSDSRVFFSPEGPFLTSISHFRLARSRDGVHFTVDEAPAFAAADRQEEYGIEDPRISCIDGTYYLTYSAISRFGITTNLASTRDFRSFERRGAILHPDNKDTVIFPQKIGERYYALHRPHSPFGGLNIWIAESPDLLHWGNHRLFMTVRRNQWDGGRVGASTVPVRIDEGWLEIYHGATADNRYCLGAVLTDPNDPGKILARSKDPILEPEAPYETEGFFGNVVFSCGALLEGDKLRIYYGAADTSTAAAEVPLGDVLDSLE